MAIQLPDDIERSIRAAVQDGHFPSPGEAVAAAWLAFEGHSPPVPSRPALTVAEFHRQLLADGAIAHLPDPSQDTDDDDEPVVIAGESLSATILRERR